jgi:hypothetical protein
VTIPTSAIAKNIPAAPLVALNSSGPHGFSNPYLSKHAEMVLFLSGKGYARSLVVENPQQ